MLRLLDGHRKFLQLRLRSFQSDDSGATMVIFALLLMMLFGMAALGIDYAKFVRTNGSLQSAADSAALSAASAALQQASKVGITSQSAMEQIDLAAKQAAKAYFENNASGDLKMVSKVDVQTSVVQGRVEVMLSYDGKMPTAVAGLFGYKMLSVAGVAKAVAKVQPYVDVYLMIDTSGSMAFGASTSDQQRLVSATGCQFACHDNAQVNGYADAFSYANANGITLRIGALNLGIHRLMDEIDSTDPGHRFIRTAVYSFNNALTNDAALTTDTSQIRNRLPQAPAISGETEGATHFKENIAAMVRAIGMGGDGTTQDRAIKLFFLATDGAQDPGRYWTSDVAAREEVDAFDMAFCETLKGDKVQVGVIYTPYLPMPSDWGYLATLDQPSHTTPGNKRIDDISPRLQKCGGTRFVLADDAETIRTSFAEIFQSLAGVYLAK